MSASILTPGVNQLIETLQALNRLVSQILEQMIGGTVFRAPSYTVATLPAVTVTNAGQLAFASNARNTGEGAGLGTGTLCCVNKSGVWVSVWSGVAPTT